MVVSSDQLVIIRERATRHGRGSLRRWAVLAALALVATLMAGVPPAAADAGDMHTFSGTITADGGSALSGMTVSVFCQGCPDGSHSDPSGNPARLWPAGARLLGEATTDASGNWLITVAEPASGRPQVLAWDPDRDYAPAAWLRDRWADTAGLDEAMAGGGVLSGRILADGSPPPAGDYTISVGVGYYRVVLGVVVGANGEYSTPALPDGTYHLTYPSDLPAPYVPGPYPSWLLGTVAGGDAVADHELVHSGSISGRVTDGSGNGLSGILAYHATPYGRGSRFRVLTDGDGHYNSGPLTPDDEYYIYFESPDDEYASEFVSPVVVPPVDGDVTNVDVQLALAGSISGYVTGPLGLPASARIRISACSPDLRPSSCRYSYSTRSGYFEFGVLGPATYELRAGDVSESVVLAEGEHRQVDVTLAGGRISGVVTDASGAPIGGVAVSFSSSSVSVVTAGDGSYMSPLLGEGDHIVRFGSGLAEVESVAVADGVLTSGVDVQLDVGFIEGTVTSGGTPLADVRVDVEVFRSGYFRGVGATVTGADGSYRLAAAAGDYRVGFSSAWHVSEFFDGAAQVDQADTVVVAVSSTVGGVDADLVAIPPPVAPPEGTVVSGGSSAPGGIPSFGGGETVMVSQQGCANGSARLRASELSGHWGRSFSMPETPAGSGTYAVSFAVADLGSAGRVDVSINVYCDDSSQSAEVGFSVYIDPSGVVRDQNGDPVQGATVTLLRDDPGTVAADFEAVADGSVLMDPAINSTNPDVTGADGEFRWDVVAGLWKVRAEAAGCHAPGDASTAFVETAELVVPPPRLGLVLELECQYSVGGSHGASVEAIEAEGLLTGTYCGPGRFCPRGEMKRSTMAVWLVRALDGDDPAPVSSSRFADVDPDAWWAPFAERLAELEVTAGCKTGPLRYCPDESVTREQMATFLKRAFELADADPAGFVDTGGTHAPNIDALAAAGITAGCRTEPLSYCPKDPVGRDQMATFLARALGLVPLP